MRHETSIFLVTYEGLPKLTEDDQILREAIEEQGCIATPVCWDDPHISWRDADATVLRSTWNYIFSPQRFTSWIESTSSQTVLVNTKELLLWNMHKRYLIDLRNSGIAIIPTSMILQGMNVRHSLERALKEFGDKIVIKPAISCASNLTRIFSLADPPGVADAAKHLEVILLQSDALIQPLIKEVFSLGEQSLVFLNGEYSHTVAKEPFRQGTTPTYATETVKSEAQEIAFGKNVLSKLPSLPIYARVDILLQHSQPLLNELELIEPELHLGLAAGSATKLASLIIEKCRKQTVAPLARALL